MVQYNFKSIDYRLSNQNFIFKLINIPDEGDYKFKYIPYSELPALLMLDFILATKPSEYNVDVFEYFNSTAIRELDRYGDHSLLLLSEGVSKRNAFPTKLGLLSKDINKSELEHIVHHGNLFRENKGGILVDALGSVLPRKENIIYLLGGELVNARDGDRLEILSLNRFFNSKGDVIDSLKLLQRQDESEIDISSLAPYDYLARDIDIAQLNSMRLVRDNKAVILSNTRDFDLNKAVEVSSEILSFREYKDKGELAPLTLGNTLNQFGAYINNSVEGLKFTGVDIVGLDSFYKPNYLKAYLLPDSLGTLESSRLASIESNKLFFSRETNESAYLDVDIGLYNKIINGTFVSQTVQVNKYSSINLTPILSAFSRVNMFKASIEEIDTGEIGASTKSDLITSINMNSENTVNIDKILYGSLDNSKYVDLSTINTFNKDSAKDIELHEVFTTSFDTSKGGVLEEVKFSSNEDISSVKLHYSIYGFNSTNRETKLYFGGVGLKEVDRETKLYHNNFGLNISERDTYVQSISFINKEKDVIVYFSDNATNGTERDVNLYYTIYGLNISDRESYLQHTIFSDKEKDLKLFYTENAKRVVDRETHLYNSLLGLNDTDRESYIQGFIYADIGKDSVLFSPYVLMRDYMERAFIDSPTYSEDSTLRLGNYHISNLNGESLSREGGVYVYNIIGAKDFYVNVFIPRLNIMGDSIENRQGEIEYTVEFFKPRKKLIKSWLNDFERDKSRKLLKHFFTDGERDRSKKLIKDFGIDAIKPYRLNKRILLKSFVEEACRKNNENILLLLDNSMEGKRETEYKLYGEHFSFEGLRETERGLSKDTTLATKREKYRVLFKSFQKDFDYEKDADIEEQIYTDKYKENPFIARSILGQSLLYDYSDIVDEGMDVEHWDVGYAIPEDYDPQDPFNPYYPWAEERNKHSIVQEEDWENTLGNWDSDKGNAIIKSQGGKPSNAIMTTKKPYKDFKFKFNTQVGYSPDCRSGFVFNYDDVANYYKITLSSGNKPIELIQVIDGKERLLALPMAPFYMDGGSRHSIDVSYVKDRLVVYVDGRLQYDLVIED